MLVAAAADVVEDDTRELPTLAHAGAIAQEESTAGWRLRWEHSQVALRSKLHALKLKVAQPAVFEERVDERVG